MDVTLRPFQEADRDAALGLFLELNRHEFAITGDRRTDLQGAEFCVQDMELLARNGGHAVVAEANGSVVGLLVWAPRVDEPYLAESARGYGHVEDIVVAEAHRGKGIGRILLAEAERLTRAAGLSRMKLTVIAGNDGAMVAYERAGFKHYARTMLRELSAPGGSI